MSDAPQPRCSRCGTTDTDRFSRCASSRTGYQSWCRECFRTRQPTCRSECVEWLVHQIHMKRDEVWGMDHALGTALGMCAFWLQKMAGVWVKEIHNETPEQSEVSP